MGARRGAGIFDFGGLGANGRPFFSRRIGLTGEPGEEREVPILVGGKLTGRVGRFNLGFLEVLTGSEGDLERKSLGVGRVSMNLLEESALGVIATHGDPSSNDHNWLVGGDFNYRNSRFRGDRVLSGRAWLQQSFTTGIHGERAAWGGEVAYPNDRTNWRLAYKEIQANFQPKLGFVNRADIRQYDARYRHRVRFESVLRTLDARLDSKLVTDRRDVVRTGLIQLRPLVATTTLGDSLSLRYVFDYEHPREPRTIQGVAIAAEPSYAHRGVASLASTASRPLRGSFAVTYGQFFEGMLLKLSPSVEWRPSRYLLLGVDYERSRLEISRDEFTSHLLIGRVEVQFTTDLSWNTLVQYDNASESIGINSRLRWIIVPGRELFIVMNQGFVTENGGFEVGRSEPLIKLRWTFRF